MRAIWSLRRTGATLRLGAINRTHVEGVPKKWYDMEKHKRPGEIVAYEGKKFTSEWYYDDAGNSQALEYAESLEEAERKKLAALFMVLGDLGQLRNKEKFRYEGDKIYAFKPKPHRFLAFFFEGAKVIVTNAFQKKTDKLPSTEKERAIRCLKDYQLRVKAGNYYGKE